MPFRLGIGGPVSEELLEHLSVQHETEKITAERRSRVGDQQRTARIRPLAIGGSAGSAPHIRRNQQI